MNYLWGGMILVGILYAAFHGTLPQVTEAALNSAKEAVTLCITMTGVMSFWVGLMKIAEKTGMIDGATRKISPCLSFLFPRIPKNHPARKYIAVNLIANVFGLGWAATPAGLCAMKELSALQMQRRGKAYAHVASKEMCVFLIINISSLQLIPVNIIAYRTQYGSVNPAAVVGPGIVATMISTLAAVVFCSILNYSGRNTDRF